MADYLEAHVDDLLSRAGRGAVPPAWFISPVDRGRFDSLRTASSDDFLGVAQELARSLQAQMDGRTKKGFFVALRRQAGKLTVSAVLKLDVHDELAAAISDQGQGPDLAAVKDLLDIPGQLQKGALAVDPRAGSDVVVGELFPETSQYFLRALGISQALSEPASVGAFINAVYKAAPERMKVVLDALEVTPPLSATAFLNQHPNLLSVEQRAEVQGRLDQLPRRLQDLNPSNVPVRRKIVADGITITGNPHDLANKVRIDPRQGGWRITIDVDEEPDDRPI